MILPSYHSTPWPGIDHADGLALGFEDRTLFDMQFDEAGEFLGADRCVSAIADAVQALRRH